MIPPTGGLQLSLMRRTIRRQEKIAAKLKTALADTEDALREYAELEGLAEDEVKDQEDKLVDEMLSHGKHKNLSFFALLPHRKQKLLKYSAHREKTAKVSDRFTFIL